MMTVGDLAAGLAGAVIAGEAGTPVRGLAYRSADVRPGSLFIAIRGFVHDGHDFIPEAAEKGATAFLVENLAAVPPGRTAIAVADSRKAAAVVAGTFFGNPSAGLRLVGITGTNGKTTTAYLTRAVLERKGPAGLIGTVQNVVAGSAFPVARTTPEAVDLQRLLGDMLAGGDRYAVMEVSSHALSLHRVDSCEFDIGVFTNLTRDHLDFHGGMRDYLEAKGLLFERLGEACTGKPKDGPKGAVINADDPHAGEIRRRCRVPVLTYCVSAGAGPRAEDTDLRAEDIDLGLDGASFTVAYPGGRIPVRLQLTGMFNVYNALAAFGVGLIEGMGPAAIAAALGGVTGVPGRFELVRGRQPFAVIVDYAHTPDGLENVLTAARRFTTGRLIAVFGCGGDRDRSKRPLMGEIGARIADLAVITSDNPRSEDPLKIAAEVEEGARLSAGASYRVVVDREEAITGAIREAGPGDTVLIAGKGHETYQIFRERTVPFDDREVARRSLGDLGYL